jgi:hypothetical protein
LHDSVDRFSFYCNFHVNFLSGKNSPLSISR